MNAAVDPGDVFGEILGGAIVGAVLVPVFQEIMRQLLLATPQPEGAALTYSLLWLLVYLMPLLPIVGTIVGFAVAYGAGGGPGLLGYVMGVLGASALFNGPQFAMSLFIAGFVVFAFAVLFHSGSGGSVGRVGRF